MESKQHSSDDLKKTWSEVRTIADDVRVRLHLLGMDAKDKWNREIEPQLFSMEKRVEREVGDAVRTALHDLRTAVHAFRDSIKRSSVV